MVQVLPEVPSFGSLMARGIGAGLQAGAGQGMEQAFQKSLENQKMMNKLQLAMALMGGQVPDSGISDMGAKMGGQPSIGGIGDMGKQLAGQPKKEADPFKRAMVAGLLGESDLSRSLTEKAKIGEKERLGREKEEREILSIIPKKHLENISNYSEHSRGIDLALGAELDAINAGEVDPFSKGHIAELGKQFGLPPALMAPFETIGSKEFKTGQKTFLTKTFGDAFRGATTQGQIQLASSLLAETGAKRESNLASVFFLQAQHMVAKEEVRLTEEAIEKGVPTNKLKKFVDKQLDVYAKDVNDQYFDAIKTLRQQVKKK